MTENGFSVQELAEWPAMGFFGNVFIRRIELLYKGMVLPGHTHNYDHATFVGKGKVAVKWTSPTDGSVKMRIFTAPDWFEVPAKAVHEITALSNNCVTYCVFAVRDADGAIAEFVQEHHLENREYSNSPSMNYGT